MNNVKEKIISAKNKILVASASASVFVLTTATNAFAAEEGVTIDYGSIATSTKDSVLGGVNAMLPILAGLFGTIAAIKFAPKLIKKFIS